MRYRFNSFLIDTRAVTLVKAGVNLDIEPKIFNLLCYFCENSGRAISRNELITHVWQGRVVSDAAINRAVSELRKCIEDDPKKPVTIKTVSKVGYQFTADITQTNFQSSLKTADTKNLPYKLYFVVAAVLAIFGVTTILYMLERNVVDNVVFDAVAETPVSTLKGSAFKPQISASGQVLFLHRNKTQKNVQISLKQESDHTIKLTDDEFYYTYAIFKNEQSIFATRFDNLDDRNCDIVEINIISKVIEEVAACAKRAVTNLAYDSNTNKLFYNYRANVSSPFAIYSLQLSTGRIQQLTYVNPDGNGRGDYRFSLSPSGSKLAILEYQQNGAIRLKLLERETSSESIQLNVFDTASNVSWLSEDVILISDKEGVLAIDIVSGNENRILANKNVTQAMSNQSAQQITFVKFDSTLNVHQSNLITGAFDKSISKSAFVNRFPTYANQSNSIAYLSSDTSELQIYVKPSGGDAYSIEFPYKISHFSNLVWSDNDQVLIVCINSSLYMYSFQNNQWSEFGEALKNIHYVAVYDSENVIVSSDLSGDWQLWKLNLKSSNATQLTKTGGYSAQYSKLMNKIYFTKFSQPGLYALDIQSLIESTVLEDFKITDWNKWKVNNGSLFRWGKKSMIGLDLFSNKEIIMSEITAARGNYFSVNNDNTLYSYSVIESEKASVWQNGYLIK